MPDREKVTDIVRCKDCIHCGDVDTNGLHFPDDRCPCKCEDFYYSWLPDPDWFCANGERRVSGDA